MAYDGNKLSAIVLTIEGQGPQLWNYITPDSLATVMAAAYLSDAKLRGMRIGDLILVAIGTLNTAVYTAPTTADVGEVSDFSAVPTYVWLQVVSFTANAANLAGQQVNIGGAATDKVGFFGVTPVVQPSGTNQAAVTSTAVTSASNTASTSTTPFGFTTSTQFNAVLQAVNSMVAVVNSLSVWQNQIRTDLVALGLEKGSN